MEESYCQSCGMPMSKGLYGKEADGSESADYCKYCYADGKFTSECTMEEMIEFCIKPMVENTKMSEDAARKMMQGYFPKLKRWQ